MFLIVNFESERKIEGNDRRQETVMSLGATVGENGPQDVVVRITSETGEETTGSLPATTEADNSTRYARVCYTSS